MTTNDEAREAIRALAKDRNMPDLPAMMLQWMLAHWDQLSARAALLPQRPQRGRRR